MEKGVEMRLTNPRYVQTKNPLEESGFSDWINFNFKLINTICTVGISIALITLVLLLISA
jgi:hypothetical protein